MRVLARGKSRGSFGGGWPTMPKPMIMSPGTSGSIFVVPADWTPGIAATRCRSWSKNALCSAGVPYLVSGSPICAVMTLAGRSQG